jgi:SAM-dependent methyltransferase
LNLKSQISNLKFPPCDLCGATDAEFILATPRLDGPLVRCRQCQLYFVIKSEPLPARVQAEQASHSLNVGAAAEMERLAGRARELALVEPQVEVHEQPWRALVAEERLAELRQFISRGRLLELGCSTGELLAAAAPAFEAIGVEADAKTSAIAQARGLHCVNGTLSDAQFPDEHFDAAVLYHVIEHLPSPVAAVREFHRILKPGGWLVLEAPNIDTFWFRLLGARWRQFIPDHIFFFSPATLTRLCETNGFAVRECRSVGKACRRFDQIERACASGRSYAAPQAW